MSKSGPVSPLLILAVVSSLSAFSGQDVRNRPANSWVAYPSTQLQRVTPPGDSYPNILGASGVAAIVSAWCGGAYDPVGNRLLVWGGGHNDYYGNELYAFYTDSLKWERLTNPTANPNSCNQVNGDGTPIGRHTYSGLAFITHANRFFGTGGCWDCPGGGCGLNKTWTFDMAAKTWHDMNPSGTGPGTNCEDNCAYDPYTRKVYYFDANGLYAYDYDSNSWSHIDNNGRYNHTCAVDTKRHLLVNVGHNSVRVYDLTQSPPVGSEWTTTGGSAFISLGAVGLDYDTLSDKIVGWHGGSIYALDMDARTWTSTTAANAPAPCSNGTFGRWRYAANVNAFVNVNATGANVYFYKLTAGPVAAEKKAPLSAVHLSANPNPFSGAIRFSVGRSLLESEGFVMGLYSPDGRLVRDLTREASESFSARAEGLPAGIYLLKVSTAAGGFTRRLALTR